jgi:hypothetical protein
LLLGIPCYLVKVGETPRPAARRGERLALLTSPQQNSEALKAAEIKGRRADLKAASPRRSRIDHKFTSVPQPAAASMLAYLPSVMHACCSSSISLQNLSLSASPLDLADMAQGHRQPPTPPNPFPCSPVTARQCLCRPSQAPHPAPPRRAQPPPPSSPGSAGRRRHTSDSCIPCRHSTVPAMHPARRNLSHRVAHGPWASPLGGCVGFRVPAQRALDGAGSFCVPTLEVTSTSPPTTNRTWMPWTEGGMQGIVSRWRRVAGAAWTKFTSALPIGTAVMQAGASVDKLGCAPPFRRASPALRRRKAPRRV